MRNGERAMVGKISCAAGLLAAVMVSGNAWASITAPDAGGKLSIGFDGDDVTLDGSLVNSWNDQVAAGGDDDAAAGGSRRPTLTTANTGNGVHNVIDFSGGQYLKTADFVGGDMAQANAIFIVAKWDTFSNDYLFDGISSDKRHAVYTRSGDTYGMYAGSQIINGNVQAVAGEFQVFSALFNGSSSKFRVNGTNVLSGDVGSEVLGGLSIGSNYGTSGFLDGQVAEVLVYNGGLNSAQLLDIESYLQNKYVIPEPATLGLFLGGAVAALFVRRMKI